MRMRASYSTVASRIEALTNDALEAMLMSLRFYVFNCYLLMVITPLHWRFEIIAR